MMEERTKSDDIDEIWKREHCQREEAVSQAKASIDVESFFKVLDCLEDDVKSDLFRSEMKNFRETIENDLDFGDFKRFYSELQGPMEVECVLLHARKRIQNDEVIVDYIQSNYFLKNYDDNNHNNITTTGSAIVAIAGGIGVVCCSAFLSAPLAIAAVGVGTFSVGYGMLTAPSHEREYGSKNLLE